VLGGRGPVAVLAGRSDHVGVFGSRSVDHVIVKA